MKKYSFSIQVFVLSMENNPFIFLAIEKRSFQQRKKIMAIIKP